MGNRVEFNTDAVNELLKGVNIVADAVKVTFGPNGRNVIIDELGKPKMTKDGVTVASSIELDDAIPSLGATIVKDVASKTVKEVGDGTTTSTILTQAIIKEGIRAMGFGDNPLQLQKGINYAVSKITRYLSTIAVPVSQDTTRLHIATTSVNGDKSLAELATIAHKVAGIEGIIKYDYGIPHVESVRGVEVRGGYTEQAMVKDDQAIMELSQPYILLTSGKLGNIDAVIDMMSTALDDNKPFIIVATDISPEIKELVKANNRNSPQPIVFVKVLGLTDIQREYTEDIASILGKSLADSSYVTGRLESALITKDHSRFVPITDDDNINLSISKRIEHINSLIELTSNEHDISRLKQRIALLEGKVATIYIDAESDLIFKEKKDRLDDALNALLVADKYGTIIGAGLPLARAAALINIPDDEPELHKGILVIQEACKEPAKLVYANSPVRAETVIKFATESPSYTEGINVFTGEKEDFYKTGIIDPVQVTISALTNAAAAASMFLTTGCVVSNTEKISL
jgi:chaperonin GroEL